MVDEFGQGVMEVGNEGFNAGESNTLNDEVAFEPPSGGDVSYYQDNEYADELESMNIHETEDTTMGDSDSSGWLDSFDSGSSDSSSCSSCGSCSSCSSCG